MGAAGCRVCPTEQSRAFHHPAKIIKREERSGSEGEEERVEGRGAGEEEERVEGRGAGEEEERGRWRGRRGERERKGAGEEEERQGEKTRKANETGNPQTRQHLISLELL